MAANYEVVGYQYKSFRPKDGSDEIRGYTLYMTVPRTNVTGEACETVFLSERKAEGYTPAIGDRLRVLWNKFGKVDCIEPV